MSLLQFNKRQVLLVETLGLLNSGQISFFLQGLDPILFTRIKSCLSMSFRVRK